MSSAAIPKEQLSAYQRWEMASFDDKPIGPSDTIESLTVPLELPVLPTAEEITTILENARLEGYALGLEEGRQTGKAETDAAMKEALLPLQKLAENYQILFH